MSITRDELRTLIFRAGTLEEAERALRLAAEYAEEHPDDDVISAEAEFVAMLASAWGSTMIKPVIQIDELQEEAKRLLKELKT